MVRSAHAVRFRAALGAILLSRTVGSRISRLAENAVIEFARSRVSSAAPFAAAIVAPNASRIREPPQKLRSPSAPTRLAISTGHAIGHGVEAHVHFPAAGIVELRPDGFDRRTDRPHQQRDADRTAARWTSAGFHMSAQMRMLAATTARARRRSRAARRRNACLLRRRPYVARLIFRCRNSTPAACDGRGGCCRIALPVPPPRSR